MLGKLLTPFTTATAGGTVFRDVFIMAGSIITLLGLLGVLSSEQVDALKKVITDISGNWPAIAAAFGLLMASGMSIYRALFMSSSNKAAEAAHKIDAELPPSARVEIVTPPGQPNIVVPSKPAK